MVSDELHNRGQAGKFIGYRVNCEGVPALPAKAVRSMLNDPRHVPYLLMWPSPRDGKLREIARVARFVSPQPESADMVEIKSTHERISVVRYVWRPVPRNGGRDLFLCCPQCKSLRRYLYSLEASKASHRVEKRGWHCRKCAGLSYASEGSALVFRTRFPPLRALCQFMRNLPRPSPWYPRFFANPMDAVNCGLATIGADIADARHFVEKNQK